MKIIKKGKHQTIRFTDMVNVVCPFCKNMITTRLN